MILQQLLSKELLYYKQQRARNEEAVETRPNQLQNVKNRSGGDTFNFLLIKTHLMRLLR